VRYQFAIALWGKHYVEDFLRYALPACLTTGNLCGFARYDSEFDIYTVDEDNALITSAPVMQALAAFTDIRITRLIPSVVPTGRDNGKYALMNAMHKLAIERSAETNSAVFFLGPDVALADGTLAHVREQLEAGKRLVMMGSVRVARAGFLAELRDRFNPYGRCGMQIRPRDLIDLVIRHPHAGFRSFCWGNRDLVDWPSHLYFPVGDEGFVQRGFHLHPIAIAPQHRGCRPSGSVDDGWLTEAVPNLADWHVIQDSDDGYAVDFGMPPDAVLPAQPREDAALHVARWAQEHVRALQWEMARLPVLVHRSPLSPLTWNGPLAESSAILDRIRSRMRALETPPLPVG
jgi:hypothetical protein